MTTAEAIAAVNRIRGYVKVYLNVKGSLSEHQRASLETDLGTLDKDLGELAESLDASSVKGDTTDPVPAPVSAPVSDTSGFFIDVSDPDEPYIVGGSPSNPNGVSFNAAAAIEWWQDVFANGYNIGKVRATLTPGSHVLTAEGLTAARELGKTSTLFAPEDYNPDNLPVHP